MQPKINPLEFSEQDWSQFDFGSWNLEDLELDEVSKPLANLAQKLFASSEWQENFAAAIPNLKQSTLQALKQRQGELKATADKLEPELQERQRLIRQQVERIERERRQAQEAPELTADPSRFQFGVKVLHESAKLGLPYLVVRVINQQQPEQPLLERPTDAYGNAILSLTEEQIAVLTGKKRPSGEKMTFSTFLRCLSRLFVPPGNNIGVAIEILTPEGKVLQRTEKVLTFQGNGIETEVVTLATSPDLDPSLNIANKYKEERESRQAELTSSIERLQVRYEAMRQDISTEIEEIQSMIEAIEAEPEASSPENPQDSAN